MEWYWFKDYLSNRQQATFWQGSMSDFGPVTVGVPQGSILGPLLFILFINDLSSCVKHSRLYMYADDSTQEVSGHSVKDVEDKLSEDFGEVSNWMKQNKLTLHIGKTKSQLIGSSKKVKQDTKMNVNFAGKTIEQVHVTKLLGVHIDSNLTWASQFESVCKMLSQRIGILYRIRGYIPKNVAIQVFNALVLPHMDFCSTVWGRPANKVFTDRITKLQKRAARIILQCKISEFSSFQLFHRLKWMPFEERVNFKRSVLMYKCINGLTPDYLQNFRYLSHQH